MCIDRTRRVKGKIGFRLLIAALMLLLVCLTDCLAARAASTADWYAVSGTYNRVDASQYNCGKLQLLPLDNGGVLFELECYARGAKRKT
jgi:hypothetical protein